MDDRLQITKNGEKFNMEDLLKGKTVEIKY